MKFAYLALLGFATAQDETELVGERWRWDAVGPLMQQEIRIMETLGDMEPEFERAERKIEKMLRKRVPKYLPYLEAWGHSPSVRAKQAHDEKIMKSKYGQRMMSAIMKTGEDAMKVHWTDGMDQDGYAKWIDNKDAAMMFEDVYEIKEALKALVESKMAMVNGKLGEATLNDKNFHKIVELFFQDMEVKNMDELIAKLNKMGMEAAKKMHKCKKMQRLFRQIGRLVDMAERTKEVFDLPSEKEFTAWWGKHDFQPWI